ncbi:hypothetical protein [Anaerotignum lactatifermentans]|uniref:hypothetical protein n=1 Tax=Anaerotignum lactatifermentans TaxID=160404 RepID=UPI00187459B8|nr:hypothetical protein [Anaerotignum lactatifermentans]MBE5077495.1 hypothetical protein [Anaerotignum lactatifermentans]
MQRMQEYDARHIFRAANFLKALKYGKSGPFAAAEVLWDQKENIGKGLVGLGFLLLLPILFLCMLPSFFIWRFWFYGGFEQPNSYHVKFAILSKCGMDSSRSCA